MYKKAARVLADRGFTNIRTFPAGIPGWVAAGYKLGFYLPLPKEVVPEMDAASVSAIAGDVTVVDIRTGSLYEMGWVAGSYRIPLAELTTRWDEIPKGKPIVVIDHLGKQVTLASRFLMFVGYKDVSRLQGGLKAWMSAGLPLETNDRQATR